MMKKIILILISLMLLITSCGKESTPSWQEQYDLGMKYLSEEKYEEAIVAFTVAIEIDPKQAIVYLNRGQAYLLMEETDENIAFAITDYEQVIALDETIVEAYLQLGEIYIDLGNYDDASLILENGYESTNNEVILKRLVSVKEMSVDMDESMGEKSYQRIYSNDIYEEYLANLEICMSGENFDNPNEIEDLSLFFEFFSMNEFSYEEQEEWYDSTAQMYKIPGVLVRNTLQKHMDFENIVLEDYFDNRQESDIRYYDSVEDFYCTKYFGGFGGEHEGYETVECTVVETGIVEAIGSYERYNGETYVIKVLVKEEPNDVLKLISFNEERIWSENTIVDATSGPLTLSGTLTKETGTHPNGDEFTGYMLILDNPIPHLQVEDWDGYVSVIDDVEKIQITMDDRNILESSIGKHVTVEGTASYALTAWYLEGLYLKAYSLK